MTATIEGDRVPAASASVEEFITEHYWGYATQRDGTTVEYEVEHPPWRIWQGQTPELDCDVAELYGAELLAPLSSPPSSAFVADGSEIVVRRGARIGQGSPESRRVATRTDVASRSDADRRSVA